MSFNLHVLLESVLCAEDATQILAQLSVDPRLLRQTTFTATRAEIAQAMNMILFHGLVRRVPAAQDYIADVVTQGRRVMFDHGALRTVCWPMGALPAGEAAFTRLLRPLGFQLQGTYPLPRLKMTGRAYCHQDFPQTIAQFFVSELHPEQFSERFQAAVGRVFSTSRDPLGAQDMADLAQLERDGVLPLAQALRLLPALVRCFDRQHGGVRLEDYELLKSESAEAAWIATEGNAFNHATDRVADVDTLAERQRALGRPIKDVVEVSASGRVRQTAFRAVMVKRKFITAKACVLRDVPGSFYEFITRSPLPAPPDAPSLMDLAFDAGNATGIFGMTAAA
jgi:hypothetical protein